MKGNKFPLVLMPDVGASSMNRANLSSIIKDSMENHTEEYTFEIKGNTFELTQVADISLTEAGFIDLIFGALSNIDIDPASWSFMNLTDEDNTEGWSVTHYILTIHLIQP